MMCLNRVEGYSTYTHKRLILKIRLGQNWESNVMLFSLCCPTIYLSDFMSFPWKLF